MTLIYNGGLWTIQSFVSGFENNAYLITCKRTGSSVIIDTPDNPQELLEAAAGTDVRTILVTHNHRDHLQGLSAVTSAFADAPVGIGADDAHAINGRAGQRLDVSHDSVITPGDISLRCIATPGHTPGSTCFMLPAERPGATPHVFTGDTLFPGGPGKSGSPQEFQQLVTSIASRLLTLPADTVVLPGHGRATTVAESNAEHDQFLSRPRRDGLHGDVTWTGDNG